MEQKEETTEAKPQIQLVNDDTFKRIKPKIEYVMMLSKTKLSDTKSNL